MMYVGRIFCLLSLCFLISEGLGQRKEAPPPVKPSRGLHALVVGISQYQSKAIPALQFADKDARLFAEFLRTEAGGNISADNLSILLNERATFSAIYQAMFELMKKVRQNDTVYFYFSGHGDAENQTVFNLGYLLGFDSPPNNYINHAVRIEDINNFANTLSVRNNAKVILITDACRSGKLAGDMIGGRRLISTHLLKTQRNEIRLASCGPEELSVENQGWGGGRGVFSYYLLQGLQGLASAQPLQIVTGKDLQNFMTTAFKQDKILLRDGHIQTPIITGNLVIPMSKPTEQSLAQLKQSQVANPKMPAGLASISALREIPLQPQAYVVKKIKDLGIDKIIDFRRPIISSPQQFASRVLDAVGASDNPFGEQDERITKFRGMLRTDSTTVLRFNEQLAQLICELGQQAIALYLKSDWIALEERQYYNFDTGDFQRYIHMYQYALQLIPKDHFLYRTLQTDYYYFLGTHNRMQQLLNPDDKTLLSTAKQSLHQALQTEPYAPYVHNELGNVFLRLWNQDSALHHYKLASELSPTWAIPFANLVGVYYLKGDLLAAREISKKGIDLQPTLFNLLVNKGLVEEALQNRLYALELYQQAITQNGAHYLPFERLGMLHANMMQFAKADSFFYESQNRKLGYDFAVERDIPILTFGAGPISLEIDSTVCSFPSSDSLRNFFPYQLVLGYRALQNKNDSLAQVHLKEASRNGGDRYFLTNHFLGLTYYRQGKMTLAAHYFDRAIVQFQDSVIFAKYLEQTRRGYKGKEDISCILSEVSDMYYNNLEDHFLLANVYDHLGYYGDAVKMYEEINRRDKTISFYQGWYLLAALHEKYAMWEAAEHTWYRFYDTLSRIPYVSCFSQIYEFSFQRFELQQFYSRVLMAHPAHAGWHRKAAVFFYETYRSRGEKEWEEDPNVEGSEHGMHEKIYGNKMSAHYNCFMKLNPTPGTQNKIPLSVPVAYPYRNGLNIFRKAIALNTEKEILQLLYVKYAEYLSFAGKQNELVDALTQAIDVSPENASLRHAVVDAFRLNGHYYQAYVQMDSLRIRRRLLPLHSLEYARLAMLAGNFTISKSILSEALEILPDSAQKIASLQFDLNMLEGNSKAVISLLEKKVKEQPDDFNVWYSLARMYAETGEHRQAIASIKNAFEKGFPYGYLLVSDPALNSMRDLDDFKTLYESKISYIKYH